MAEETASCLFVFLTRSETRGGGLAIFPTRSTTQAATTTKDVSAAYASGPGLVSRYRKGAFPLEPIENAVGQTSHRESSRPSCGGAERSQRANNNHALKYFDRVMCGDASDSL